MINKVLGSVFGRKINLKGAEAYAESMGYYDRVPIRVGSFVLKKNKEEEVVFYTTCKDFCGEGPEVVVTVTNGENGWFVNETQGHYCSQIAPSVDLSRERLERRRAFWHAKEYMLGNDMNYKERFSLRRQNEEDADLFADDAFFKNGNSVTTDPFGAFLK
jgi:hypothetical protein